ncbi:MAG: hypothetical protein AB1Z98_23095 [Nannocystaceae bacterium]
MLLLTACGDDPVSDGLPGAESGESSDGETDTGSQMGETTGDIADGSTTAADPQAPLPVGFEDELTDAWGCGDLLVHLANPERTIMLTASWPDLLSLAEESGTTITWEVAFGIPIDGDITLTVQTGTDLDAQTCNSVSEGPAVVEHVWSPSSGVLRLMVSPSAQAPLGAAGLVTARLIDLVLLREADGEGVTIADHEVADIQVHS